MCFSIQLSTKKLHTNILIGFSFFKFLFISFDVMARDHQPHNTIIIVMYLPCKVHQCDNQNKLRGLSAPFHSITGWMLNIIHHRRALRSESNDVQISKRVWMEIFVNIPKLRVRMIKQISVCFFSPKRGWKKRCARRHINENRCIGTGGTCTYYVNVIIIHVARICCCLLAKL